MIYVGIDVAKDKHDCSILDRNGIDLCRPFSFSNNRDGFDQFFSILSSLCPDMDKVKVGLEATGHYSFNILGFLLDKGLHPFVLNPLHTSLVLIHTFIIYFYMFVFSCVHANRAYSRTN